MQSMLELSPYALYQAGHLPIQAVLTEKLQSALALCRTPTVSADEVASKDGRIRITGRIQLLQTLMRTEPRFYKIVERCVVACLAADVNTNVDEDR